MAKKKTKKQAENQVRKAAKKHPVLVTIAILLIVAIAGCCILHRKGVIHIPFLDKFIPQEINENTDVDATGGEFTSEDIETIKNGDLSIHFMVLGNKYSGDSTLIKVGDTEVLIDAGSRVNSAPTITSYINRFCTDGVLEYVIATHADRDHIAAFPKIFENYECETIIDFPRTNATSDTYNNYVTARTAEIEAGATHYTALECYKETNGAQKSYALGNGITMNFLYQEFYETDTNDENDYSVCMLLTQTTTAGEINYLFTGDLEKDGESSLVDNNTLPKCKLFKAGHHGSKTSSTDKLLSVIQPDIVCVCCCAGSDEYKANPENTFPTQAFVDRVANYTSNVYVTTLSTDTETGYEPMNGNIVVLSRDGVVTVRCSNHATVLKDTDWFKNNRTCPSAWSD